ncbi:MAG: hypothetical protein C3F13_08370 [Anaerolineales bacterium]|nr:MAG: hypothetical protein C3F13_08370 [Anaerolineales bacterium]
MITTKEHRVEALIQIAFATGLRESEILGLRWTDLDRMKQSFKVER